MGNGSFHVFRDRHLIGLSVTRGLDNNFSTWFPDYTLIRVSTDRCTSELSGLERKTAVLSHEVTGFARLLRLNLPLWRNPTSSPFFPTTASEPIPFRFISSRA